MKPIEILPEEIELETNELRPTPAKIACDKCKEDQAEWTTAWIYTRGSRLEPAFNLIVRLCHTCHADLDGAKEFARAYIENHCNELQQSFSQSLVRSLTWSLSQSSAKRSWK